MSYTDSITLHTYSKGEELANTLSHAAGAIFTVAAVALMLKKAYGDEIKILSVLVMNLSMLLVYVTSATYHAIKPGNLKKIFRVLDHSFIFLAIVGSLFPFVLIILSGNVVAYIILVLTATFSIAGIFLTIIGFKKYINLSLTCNFIAGGAAMAVFILLTGKLERTAITLLCLCGGCYAAGALLYLTGRKLKYIHSVFHVFVLAGNIFMTLAVYNYVI